MAFEKRKSETNFGAGAEGGHAVTDWRRAVCIGNSGDGIKSHLVLNDGIEARVWEDFVGRIRPSVGDIKVRRRAIRKSPPRSTRGMGAHRSVPCRRRSGRVCGIL